MLEQFKKRSKALLAAGLLTTLVVAVAGCGGNTAGGTKDTKKMEVVATVFPVYDVAKQVGGDKINLTLLVPPGSEPHDWEPTAADLKKIGSAKLFLYNGAGLEPTDKLTTKEILKDAKPVELSKAVTLLKAEEEAEDHDHDHDKAHEEKGHDHDKDKHDDKDKHQEDKAHEEHHHQHGEYDPHVWMDPTNVIKEVDMVTKAFVEADPANKEYYEKNAAAYKEKLQKLDSEFATVTKDLPQRELVVAHEAFAYFANHYNMKQVGIMGVSPDAEPTPERMAEIVTFVKEHNVKAIFSEELISPKLADAIAKEAGVKVYVLNPIEGLTEEQTKGNESYLSLMEKNLKTLKEALK